LRLLPSRPLYLYLPEKALQDRRLRFPVLYCQDGQNLWDDPNCCFGHGGWYLNRTLDRLTRSGRIQPTILVGIPHGGGDRRMVEYTPGNSFEHSRSHPYTNYICRVVKPYIDKEYPTKKGRSHALLMGSSLGGLISLWIAHQHPELFSGAACLSGAFEVRDSQGNTFMDFLRRQQRKDLRVYLDAGSVQDAAGLTRKVRDIYLNLGWERHVDLFHFEQKGGRHNEYYWRKRVWRALRFLLRINKSGK